MALQSYYRYQAKPVSETPGGVLAQNALQRWLDQQKRSQAQFSAAEQPLKTAATMFAPGGSYGAGQRALLEENARQAAAEAASNQVASGMSSGSLATGTNLRIKRDLAQGLAGVEDQRTQFLTQILSALSGLRGTQAQTTAATVDPTFAPTLGYISNILGLQEQGAQRTMGANVAAKSSVPATVGPFGQTRVTAKPAFVM